MCDRLEALCNAALGYVSGSVASLLGRDRPWKLRFDPVCWRSTGAADRDYFAVLTISRWYAPGSAPFRGSSDTRSEIRMAMDRLRPTFPFAHWLSYNLSRR